MRRLPLLLILICAHLCIADGIEKTSDSDIDENDNNIIFFVGTLSSDRMPEIRNSIGEKIETRNPDILSGIRFGKCSDFLGWQASIAIPLLDF